MKKSITLNLLSDYFYHPYVKFNKKNNRNAIFSRKNNTFAANPWYWS